MTYLIALMLIFNIGIEWSGEKPQGIKNSAESFYGEEPQIKKRNGAAVS